MTRIAVLVFVLLGACAEVPEHVQLQPQGENVEFAYEAPSPETYQEVGKIVGIAQGSDSESATAAAKNDLRNKAGALGASVVTIDEDLGEAVPLTNRMNVKLMGRAYKPVD